MLNHPFAQHRPPIEPLPMPRPWRMWVLRIGAVLFWAVMVAIAVWA